MQSENQYRLKDTHPEYSGRTLGAEYSKFRLNSFPDSINYLSEQNQTQVNKIMKITVENIGGLKGTHKFVFDKGLNVINAPNAAGKSSLLKGIYLAFCGSVLDEDELRQYLYDRSDSGSVRIEFEDGKSAEIVLKRVQTGVKVAKHSCPKEWESYAVRDLLLMNFGSGLFQALINNDMKVLSVWINGVTRINILRKVYAKVTSKLAELKLKLKSTSEDSVNRVKNEADLTTELEKFQDVYDVEYFALKLKCESVTAQIEALNVEYDKKQAEVTKLKRSWEKIDKIVGFQKCPCCDQTLDVKLIKEMAQTISADKKTAEAELNAMKIEINKRIYAKREIEREMSVLDYKLDKLKSAFDECKKDVDFEEKIKQIKLAIERAEKLAVYYNKLIKERTVTFVECVNNGIKESFELLSLTQFKRIEMDKEYVLNIEIDRLSQAEITVIFSVIFCTLKKLVLPEVPILLIDEMSSEIDRCFLKFVSETTDYTIVTRHVPFDGDRLLFSQKDIEIKEKPERYK